MHRWNERKFDREDSAVLEGSGKWEIWRKFQVRLEAVKKIENEKKRFPKVSDDLYQEDVTACSSTCVFMTCNLAETG